MFRKALSRVGWALLGMIVLGAFCAWFVYLQLLQLDGENRRELARAAREIGTTLNELSSTASRNLNVVDRFIPEKELNEFANQLRQRNPYIVDVPRQEFSQRNPAINAADNRCPDRRPGTPGRARALSHAGGTAKAYGFFRSSF